MKISLEEIQKIADQAPKFGQKTKRRSVDRLISLHRSEIRSEIAERLQCEIVLFDEALRFIIAFEEYIHSTMPNKTRTSLVLLLGRLKKDLIAIRALIELGQESSALAITRVFLEDIELAMACCIDPDFSDRFFDSNNSKEFWSKNVAYGKIYPLIERFIAIGGEDADFVESSLKYHRDLKSFLSNHIHPTASVALKATFSLALDNPGMLRHRPFGSIDEFSPIICLYIAEVIHTFSGCCIRALISDNPPPALSGFQPCGKLGDAIVPAHVLQELMVKYSGLLWEKYQQMRNNWSIKLAESSEKT